MDWIYWIKLVHTLVYILASSCILYIAIVDSSAGTISRAGSRLAEWPHLSCQ